MKKNIVLFTLFILPLVAYLFFASGVNSFAKLPTLTKAIPDVNMWQSDTQKPVFLKDKISIVGFTGNATHKGNFFNLYEKIYNRNQTFKDFQIVMIVPDGMQSKIEELKTDLRKLGDISGWHFVFASPKEISEFYSKMKLVGNLDASLGSNNVYIVDKKLNLRGRKGKSVKGDVEYKEGYDTNLVSELHNEMTDDVKVILAEYRLALKKNHNASRKI